MANNELENMIAEREEWAKILDEAKEQVETLTDKIKAEMLARDTEELIAGRYIVRWSTFLKSTFDSSAFKREHADLYNQFTKETTQRRFCISK